MKIIGNTTVGNKFRVTIPPEGREIIKIEIGDMVGFAEIELDGKKALVIFPAEVVVR